MPAAFARENIDFHATMIGSRPLSGTLGCRLRPLALAALAALVSALAAAAAPPGPYELGKADWLWVPAGLGLGLYGEFRYQQMSPVDTARLNRNRDLWVFDRWDAGARSRLADLGSTGLQAAMLAVPMAVAGWGGWHGQEAWDGVCAEAVVYSEALAVSAGLNLWVRSFRVHPRPLVYDPEAPTSDRLSGEASGSFYSGHASAAFLSATYFAYTWSLRHPGEPENFWIWTGGLAAAGGVAALRVVAGKHYPSDVVVGGAVGAGLGLLFPWLHRKYEGGNAKVSVAILPGPGQRWYPLATLRF